MTLAEWAMDQPYRVNYRDDLGADWISDPARACAATIADGSRLQDRPEAWHLSDYLVSTVQGGTIWFSRRAEGK